MAMFHDYSLTREELRKAFDAAAARGDKLFLHLEEMTDDPMLVTVYGATASVRDQSEIVPLLRSRQRDYASVRLQDVLDLSKPFDAQMDRPHGAGLEMLTVRTRQDIAAYATARANDLALKEWKNLSFFQRLFTPQPQPKPVPHIKTNEKGPRL